MKSQYKILVAFLLNLMFSLFELIGGLWTGSVAILSDALHDLADALSIGLAFWLEKTSKRPADETHTFGYARHSVLGGLITSCILFFGSLVVISHAIVKMLNPSPIHYDGMILMAVIGTLVNLTAAFVTRDGHSVNQKAINLHMLEDVLGWITVLIGAIVMRFTNIAILDPILSICVAVFILVNACRHLKTALAIFLETTPGHIHIPVLREHLLQLDGVKDVHHIHIWSLDEQTVLATLHAVANDPCEPPDEALRRALIEHGIAHVTVQWETQACAAPDCLIEPSHSGCHHHH